MSQNHGAELCVGGTGLGGQAVCNLSLPCRVNQILPRLRDCQAVPLDQLLIVEDNHGKGALSDPKVIRILIGLPDKLVIRAYIGLEILLERRKGVSASAPEHIRNGIGRLCGNTVAQLSGSRCHDLHLHIRILFHKQIDARI